MCACSWCYEVSREMGQPSWPDVAACKPLGTCGGCFGGLKSPADRTRAQFSAGAQHRRTLALAVGRSLPQLLIHVFLILKTFQFNMVHSLG